MSRLDDAIRALAPWPCCPHCPEDPGAHENGKHDHHDVPCTTCTRAEMVFPTDAQHRVQQVLADHRRLRNTRSCSGCDWTATAPGRNGETETMRLRHEQFNAHLSALIIDTLTRPAS